MSANRKSPKMAVRTNDDVPKPGNARQRFNPVAPATRRNIQAEEPCGGAMVNTKISPRLEARIRRDFPAQATEKVIVFLRAVPDVHVASRQDPERLQAAAFILLEGDVRRISNVQEILVRDWRDILVWAGLGHSNWPDRLNEMLGPLH
jgi:hypothetical protein